MEGFQGQVMCLTYWKAAKATFPRQFEEAMSAMSVWPLYAGNEKYEVDCGLGKKHVVNLLNSSCSCRKWDLLGIPCKHAIYCMQLLTVNPKTYANTCYTVTTQLNIYNRLINLIKGPSMPLRRPKQTRGKEVDEARKSGPKLSKTVQQANCTKYGRPDHNTRTCKRIVGGNRMANQSLSLQILNQATSMDNTSSQSPLTQQNSNLTINFRTKLPFKRNDPLGQQTTVKWMPTQQINDSTPIQLSQSKKGPRMDQLI
ncbi:hypothetical protein GOBAR_AA07901 [Gossypium barbadense]|uniref:SWIM-type domain-containing protein n=1 Tax=Gossypium barbadense TaxID=3634 RepID=A0A2P5YAX1_GOSBA|nr:hypothetical protein GOBAR_AA07901 [Gossypium barbadense]